MANDKQFQIDGSFTRDDLLSQGIYDLRKLGREVGVPSPTTLKKEQLVEAILSVIYGEMPKRNIGKGRGRPSRNGNKPCKLFLSLLDDVKEPNTKATFVYESQADDEASFNYSGLLSSRVASPKEEYKNDAKNDDSIITLKQGVVCLVDDVYYVRRYKFIPTEEDHIIPHSKVVDYNIKDNDLIEYLADEKNQQVEQLIKINGRLATRVESDISVKERLDSEDVQVCKDVIVKTNASNVIYAPTIAEREFVTDEVDRVFSSLGYNIVKVCFDRNYTENDENSVKRSLYFVDSIGDEYDSLTAIEAGINKTKFYDCIGSKTVLIVDNLSWLISVIDTYPKSVYGNFIAKLGKLSSGANSNITVVCVSSHLSNELVKELTGMFDNIIVNQPLV